MGSNAGDCWGEEKKKEEPLGEVNLYGEEDLRGFSGDVEVRARFG